MEDQLDDLTQEIREYAGEIVSRTIGEIVIPDSRKHIPPIVLTMAITGTWLGMEYRHLALMRGAQTAREWLKATIEYATAMMQDTDVTIRAIVKEPAQTT